MLQGMLFEYVTRKRHIAVAGKLLCSWPDPHVSVFPPSVDSFVVDEIAETYEAFATSLFDECGISILHDKLKIFRDTMVASLLMHLDSFVEMAKDDDVVVAKMKETATELAIPYPTMESWGRAVKKNFELKNAAQMVGASKDPAMVQKMQDMASEMIEMKTQQERTMSEMIEMKRRVGENESRAEERHAELMVAICANV